MGAKMRTRRGTEVEVISIYRWEGTIWVKARRLVDGETRIYSLDALVGKRREIKKLISQLDKEEIKEVRNERLHGSLSARSHETSGG